MHEEFERRVAKCKRFAQHAFEYAYIIDGEDYDYGQILGVDFSQQNVLLRCDLEWHDVDDIELKARLLVADSVLGEQ